MRKTAKDILKNAGLKLTKPRLLLIEVLANSKYPLSIKDIAEKVKKVDQVTIYRTVTSFKKTGLVNQIDFQKDHALFELRDNENDHHHIVCTKCDMIEDFSGCDYEYLSEKTLKSNPSFSKITGHSFEFFGICKKCTK